MASFPVELYEPMVFLAPIEWLRVEAVDRIWSRCTIQHHRVLANQQVRWMEHQKGWVGLVGWLMLLKKQTEIVSFFFFESWLLEKRCVYFLFLVNTKYIRSIMFFVSVFRRPDNPVEWLN